MAHCWSCLVQAVIWSLPVEDPHLEKVEQHVIGHYPSIHHKKILVHSNHVGPKEIIMMQIEEAIPLPSFLDHKRIRSLFTGGPNTERTSVENLRVLSYVAFIGNILQYLPP